jgi:hypothetical protein
MDKEEEIQKFYIKAIERMCNLLNFCAPENAIGQPGIMGRSIVQMHQHAFEAFSPPLCKCIGLQIRNDEFNEELRIVCNAFRNCKRPAISWVLQIMHRKYSSVWTFWLTASGLAFLG